MKIAYLTCRPLLEKAPDYQRISDEHETMLATLNPAFEAKGAAFQAIAWDSTDTDWTAFDGAIIGTTWDYWERQEEFLQTLENIEAKTRLFNGAKLARWNSRKTYLKDLAANGVRTVPTLWLDEASEDSVKAAFDHFQVDDLIFKRQIGAGAMGQYRLKRSGPLPAMNTPMMAQPFVPAIQTEGEYSFLIIGGAFSHALIKRAATDDYRIQSEYGGEQEKIDPSKADMDAALKIFSKLEEQTLYARIDMVRDEDGDLMLMEAELIEPYLYPDQGPGVGDLLATAMLNAL